MNKVMTQIDERVRELREVLGLTKEEVAEKAGIPFEEYLAYDSGQKDLPVSAMYAIASALGVDPTELLTGESPRMAKYTVVRGERGVSIERYSGYSFTSLATNYMGREMEPMIVNLKKQAAPPQIVSHKGQEFNYVLEGNVNVHVGDHVFSLAKGDSIYFDAMLPHGQAAVSDTAKFLTVINEYACK